MRLTNKEIWRAGAFDHKRQPLKVVSGPYELRWKNLITKVDGIFQNRERVVIIVAATGNDPREPSDHDLLDARLAAVLAIKQLRWRLSRKTFCPYLRFRPYTQVEVDFDFEEAAALINDYLKHARSENPPAILPTPLLSYLLNNRPPTSSKFRNYSNHR